MVSKTTLNTSAAPQNQLLSCWSESTFTYSSKSLESFLIKQTNLNTNKSFTFKTQSQPTAIYTHQANIYIGFNDGSLKSYCQDVLLNSFILHKCSIIGMWVKEDSLYACSSNGLITLSTLDGKLVK